MIQAVITDIEGTTSSLSFVHEVLFPYARARLPAFVKQHARDPAVQEQLDAVRAQVDRSLTDAQVVEKLIRWIDEDRKITPLKALQGILWEEGYRLGHFRGHVYEDAVRRLREWHAQGVRLYVYSSGSVQAQKLLFAHTDYGDLTPLFSGYFDTLIGGKREAESYQRIIEAIGLDASAVLFLSDILEELDAARAAGLRTQWVLRAQPCAGGSPHPCARHFGEIALN